MKSVIEHFTCGNCEIAVEPLPTGTRNHCPACLTSKHVDADEPGDRSAECGRLMEAIGVETRRGVQFILHRCSCGHARSNRVQPDDNFGAMLNIAQHGALAAEAAMSRMRKH